MLLEEIMNKLVSYTMLYKYIPSPGLKIYILSNRIMYS